ncbi:MAG: ATP-binding protein [Candidatus Sericytochromatia bacterium]
MLNNNLNLLVEDMSKEWSIVDPLKKDILNINYSDSAIIFYDEKINRINNSIEDKYIKKIIDYIKNLNQNILVTDEISKIIPECIDIKDNASGLMALSLSSNNYILWFKKEHIKTIDWAGKPDEKNISIENDLIRLSPRKSFEKWSESKSNKSKEWKNIEINIALKLRENIVTIILKNITILKEINRELELQRELLQSKNNELLNFASVASHDLKEPLRMVTSYNQLLLRKYKDKLDESGVEFLQYSIDGAERMRKLIESLLKYAKIGTESKEFSEIDINNVLNRVLKNLRLIIEEKSVNIKFDNMPKVIGDSTLLEVLFQNLISNSIKYNKNNPEINILCNEDKEEYIFSIKDNGIGISSDYHEAIFSMFKRLHSRSDYEGTGIGLATVKKIVEHHKGRIWLESEDEKGTVFYFTLSKNLN